MRPARRRDAGRRHNAALALVAGRAHPLPRRADPDHRQAGGRAGACRLRAAASISSTISRRCASACRSRRRWPTAWTATPAAASCSAGTARRWPAWAGCSRTGRSRRSTGRWCAAARPSARGRSSSRCASARRCAAGGWRPIRPARRRCTDYRVLGEGDGISWLECRPRTGRTHQIRVHCAALGCPVLGDPIYGGGRRARPPPLQLHARVDRPAALPQPRAGHGIGATAAAYAGGAAPVRLCSGDRAAGRRAGPVDDLDAQAGSEACST